MNMSHQTQKASQDYWFYFPVLQGHLPKLSSIDDICLLIFLDAKKTSRLKLLNYLSAPITTHQGVQIRCRMCNTFGIRFVWMHDEFVIAEIDNKHCHKEAMIPKGMMPCYAAIMAKSGRAAKAEAVWNFPSERVVSSRVDDQFEPIIQSLEQKGFKYLVIRDPSSQKVEVLVVISPAMISSYTRFRDFIKFQVLKNKIITSQECYNLGVFYAFNQFWNIQLVGYAVYRAHDQSHLFRVFDLFFKIHKQQKQKEISKPRITSNVIDYSPQTIMIPYDDIEISKTISLLKSSSIFNRAFIYDSFSVLQNFRAICKQRLQLYLPLLWSLIKSQELSQSQKLFQQIEYLCLLQAQKGNMEYYQAFNKIVQDQNQIFYIKYPKMFLGLLPQTELPKLEQWNQIISGGQLPLKDVANKFQQTERRLLQIDNNLNFSQESTIVNGKQSDSHLVEISKVLPPLLYNIFLLYYCKSSSFTVKRPYQPMQNVLYFVQNLEQSEYILTDMSCTCQKPTQMKLGCEHLIAQAKNSGKSYDHLISYRWKILKTNPNREESDTKID